MTDQTDPRPGAAFRERFNRNTPEMQARADRQGSGLLRFLDRCKYDNEFNCDHYDPLAKMTPEERETL